jgi:hypothetical protein
MAGGTVDATISAPAPEERLVKGRLAAERRLLTWLTALGCDVEIIVPTPSRRRPGQLRVHAA